MALGMQSSINARHPDWDGYDYAYKILSVWELREHIPLKTMRTKYGFKAAPRGLVYVPKSIGDNIVWNRQKKLDNVERNAKQRRRETGVDEKIAAGGRL